MSSMNKIYENYNNDKNHKNSFILWQWINLEIWHRLNF